MTRVGLAHDYLLVHRGAERTFIEMAEAWPDAPVHTLLYDAEEMRRHFAGRSLHTSGLQRLPLGQENFRRLLPLYPFAIDRMDVTAYDLLITSSSAYAHGLRVREDAVHLCYCHTPFRYAWYDLRRARAEIPRVTRPLLRAALARHRRWDRAAAGRVTAYVANSELTRRRLAAHLGRDSVVVHPPVSTHRFAPTAHEDFFLLVGELVRHKRAELALAAAERARVRVKVVGGGPEEERLRAQYGTTAEFLGRVSDAELAELMPRCRAFVLPNVEEFGIAAVEAQAAGRPVLAVDGGGARETVLPGVTGWLVAPDDVEAMARAMRDLPWDEVDPADVVRNAERFSSATFHRRLREEVDRVCGERGLPVAGVVSRA